MRRMQTDDTILEVKTIMTTFKRKIVIVLSLILSIIVLVKCTSANQKELPATVPTNTALATTVPTTAPTLPLATEILYTETAQPNKIPVSMTIDPTLKVTQELSLTSTLKPAPGIDVSNRLFMFDSAFGFHYSWLDPFTNRYEAMNLVKNGRALSNIVGSAATLAFAHFSNRIVFWVRSPDELGTLWIADINLKEPKLVYVDEKGVFTTNTSFPPRDVSLHWFPNDRYGLVKPANQRARPILVDTYTYSYQENWTWKCNEVIVSPRTSQFAIRCTDNGEQAVMEWQGEFWTDVNLSGEETIWKWEDDYMSSLSPSGSIPPWFPEGTKIAFVSESEPNTLEIITDSDERLLIQLNVATLFQHTIRWTSDGKILVGGYREDWPASWFVVDSNTGEMLWSLEETSELNLTVQQQEEQVLLLGEISASGEYVVLSTDRVDVPSGNQLLLINIKTNEFQGEIADVGRGLDAYAWGR